MVKKVCCSIIGGGIVFVFTMMLCTLFTPYPEILSSITLFYSCIMVVVMFWACEFGEEHRGKKIFIAVGFTLGMFAFTMALNIFSGVFLDIFSKMAVYYAAVAFIVSFIGYAIGERNK